MTRELSATHDSFGGRHFYQNLRVLNMADTFVGQISPHVDDVARKRLVIFATDAEKEEYLEFVATKYTGNIPDPSKDGGLISGDYDDGVQDYSALPAPTAQSSGKGIDPISDNDGNPPPEKLARGAKRFDVPSTTIFPYILNRFGITIEKLQMQDYSYSGEPLGKGQCGELGMLESVKKDGKTFGLLSMKASFADGFEDTLRYIKQAMRAEGVQKLPLITHTHAGMMRFLMPQNVADKFIAISGNKETDARMQQDYAPLARIIPPQENAGANYLNDLINPTTHDQKKLPTRR
jgi:hypothetical protein